MPKSTHQGPDRCNWEACEKENRYDGARGLESGLEIGILGIESLSTCVGYEGENSWFTVRVYRSHAHKDWVERDFSESRDGLSETGIHQKLQVARTFRLRAIGAVHGDTCSIV